MRFEIRIPAILWWIAAGARLAAADPTPGFADPTPGFVEDFTTETGGFIGGSVRSNPGTGGVDGAGDGFLMVSNASPANFGARSGTPDYSGNYLAAGVTHIRFWLNDVEGDQAFELHFGIGSGSLNFWQHNGPFQPPENGWTQFEIDLGDSTQFTQTRGSGSFLGAIQNVTNILFRHDLAPYLPNPDVIAGELGIDKIQFLNTIPVEPHTWGRIKSLYRPYHP